MDANETDETRAIAAGLARWFRDAMTESEQNAFADTELAQDVRRAGFALEQRPVAGDKSDPGRRRRVAVSA